MNSGINQTAESGPAAGRVSHNNRGRKVLIILAWLVVWQAVSLLIHNSIVMAGPLETVRALAALIVTVDFWRSLLGSFLRIVGGFLTGSALGILLAWLASRRRMLEEILSPAITVLKSVPVASFIILALLWFGASGISFFISLIVVFPMLYLNTLEGLHSVDPKQREMAEVFHIPSGSRLKYIEFPAVYPFLQSAFALALGMSWKSGVAAELIGQYRNSIGNNLYMAKIMLDTADIFAWTVVILLVSWGFEKMFLGIFQKIKPGRKSASAGSSMNS